MFPPTLGGYGKGHLKGPKLAADEVQVFVPQNGCVEGCLASHCHFTMTCYDATDRILPKEVVIMKKSAAVKLPEAQLVGSGLVDLVPAKQPSAVSRMATRSMSKY